MHIEWDILEKYIPEKDYSYENITNQISKLRLKHWLTTRQACSALWVSYTSYCEATLEYLDTQDD